MPLYGLYPPIFLPAEHGRVRRFAVGDKVYIAHPKNECTPTTVLRWVADSHPTGYEHCSGNSVKYRLEGHNDWVYDWQLEQWDVITFLQCLCRRLLP